MITRAGLMGVGANGLGTSQVQTPSRYKIIVPNDKLKSTIWCEDTSWETKTE